MADPDPKHTLVDYLQNAREAMLFKLDGLGEYDVRRPLTPTGTNLLGLVKHLASVELGYFGDTFGRPSGIDLPWHAADADPNADMWATEDETREEIVGLYQRAWAHAAVTFGQLDLDGAAGRFARDASLDEGYDWASHHANVQAAADRFR